MNTRRPQHLKKIRSENDFPACKKTLLLLKTKIETAMAPSQQRRSFKFTSLSERWSISAHSQAGGFFLWLFGGPRDPIHCGIGCLEPQGAGIDKLKEKLRLEIVA
jgi:hypothetical protein